MTGFKLFELLDQDKLNTKFSGLASEAVAAETELMSAYKQLPAGDVKTAVGQLWNDALRKQSIVAGLDTSAPEYGAAKTAAKETKTALTNFLRGQTSHTVGDKTIQLTDEVGNGLRDAYLKAESTHNSVRKPASSLLGTVRTQKDGWSTAVKKNWTEIKEFKPGTRGLAVARGGAVVGSAFAMGDALLRSKDSNGEDRGAMTRLAEFVVGGTVGTLAAVSGRAMAR